MSANSRIPHEILIGMITLLNNRDSVGKAIGSFGNYREGVPGTGLRGQISRSQGLLRWAATEAGKAKLNEQAKEQSLPGVVHRAKFLNRTQAELTSAQSELKDFVSGLALCEDELTVYTNDHPSVASIPLEELEAMAALGDTPRDDDESTSNAIAGAAASAAS